MKASLLLWPGTSRQRAFLVVPLARPDLVAAAVDRARAERPGVPLGWLRHCDLQMLPVEERRGR